MHDLIGETVTRIRAGESTDKDAHGNPIPGADAETDLDGFAFDPGGSKEPVEVGRAAVVTTPKLYRRSEADLIAGDRVRVRGLLYTVEGDPAAWVSPYTSHTAGTVVELRRVNG